MQITPITGNIGAEISGLNLKQAISIDLQGILRDALGRYLVLVYPISTSMFLNTSACLKSSATPWSTLMRRGPILIRR